MHSVQAVPRTRFISVALIALVLAGALWMSGSFDELDHSFLDFQTRWLQREIHSDVVIVEIDARSLEALGQWPLPRSMHAEVLDKLLGAGASRIFVDVDFSVASNAADDSALAASLARAGERVILPSFWQPSSTGASSLILTQPLEQFRAHARLGAVNLTPGSDGLVRTIEVPAALDGQDVATQPVWAELLPQRKSSKSLVLDYRIAPHSFERISYADAVHGQLTGLEDKTVFIGATAIELGDIVAVPVHRALPGVTVQAIAYETAARGALTLPPRALLAAALSAWALLCASAFTRVRWRVTPQIATGLITLVMGVSIALYATASVALPIAPFIATITFAFIGSLLSSLKLASWRAWQAQRSTRERDALLRQVVDRSSDAILTIDSSGRIRTANAPANALFDLDPSTPHDLVAPRDLLELLQALASGDGARELRLRRHGKTVVLEVTCSELQWDADRITSITARDITLQKDRERELRHLAEHDALTQLPNRVQLNQRLRELLAARRDDEVVALLMLDLDGFKEVNDALGHSMGDTLLVSLGARFAQLSTPQRLVARIGGDEFAIAWTGASRDAVAQLAQELLLLVQDPIPIKGVPVSLGTSVGIALSPDHASDSESLLKQADIALYVAKRRKTHVEFYDPSNDTHSPRRLEMLTSLRAAGAHGELSLHYQPKIDLRSGRATEVEALCRWHNPTLGQVPPSEFIALAEASDLIKPLTEWTIRRALLDSRDWHAAGIDLKVAVNLSARHLQDATLPDWLRELFAETCTRPEWLELEITESAIMTDPERSARILQALRELGVTVSIDDFGTGYSSLAYLRSLAVDRLKLDRSFIATIDCSERDRVVVQSTIDLAHALGLQAIAEGIETQSQYELLRELGCDVGQGYVIAKPLPLPKLLEWHDAHRCRLMPTSPSTDLERSRPRIRVQR